MKVLDLFSGIGGFSLGLEAAGMETVAFCEIDKFCQKVLKKHWPDVPIYEDVRTLDYDGAVDLICGGYPCQPFSHAGKRQGENDDRHLWPAMLELIKKHRPSWVIGENVAGHVSMGLDNVISDLASEGYGTRAFIIPAIAVDAKHRRDRVWIVANTQSAGKRGEIRDIYQEDGGSWGSLFQQFDSPSESMEYSNRKRVEGQRTKQQTAGAVQRSQDVANSTSIGQSRQRKSFIKLRQEQEEKRETGQPFTISEPRFWPTEPQLGRVANGIPNRVDRLKSLGNTVVPQIPFIIGTAIMQIESMQ